MIRKSTSIFTFAFLLMTILLLSSMFGTNVWAGKPEKPVNPGKSVKTWDLQISIGMKDSAGNPIEDIVLMADYLSAEDVPCSGGLWEFPEPKGKSGKGEYVNARLQLYKVLDETGKWIGPDCGTYHLNSVLGKNSDKVDTNLAEIVPENPEHNVVDATISHHVNPYLEQDYWSFRLIWRPKQIDPNVCPGYFLRAWTDVYSDPEVTPPEGNKLVIPFDNVDAMFTTDFFSPPELPENYNWLGKVSFTITITREPHVA